MIGLIGLFVATTASATDPVVIWSSSDFNKSVSIYGANTAIIGKVQSGGGLRIDPSSASIVGQATYATELDAPLSVFTPAPIQAPPGPAPIGLTLADYAPGGSAAIAAGSSYVDLTSSCVAGQTLNIDYENESIPPQLIYVPCDVRLKADNSDGTFTLVSTHEITIQALKGSQLQPFVNNTIAFSTLSGDDAIVINGRDATYFGTLWAPNGKVKVRGHEGVYNCGIYGWRVQLNGADLSIRADQCGQTSTNIPPVVDPISVSVNEDTTAPVTLTGTDGDADPLTFSITAQPANGVVTGTSPSFFYTPNDNYNGSDAFTVVANDGTVDSAPVVVPVTVAAVNDPPVGTAQSVSLPANGNVDIALAGTDVDGDVPTVVAVQQPANGTLTGTPPTLNYAPNSGFTGADSFAFQVEDNAGVLSAEATVSITVTAGNTAPVANDQPVVVAEDSVIAITLTGSDPEGNSLAFSIVDLPASGALAGVGANVTYTPNPDFFGSDSFTFSVSDSEFTSANATVSISVTPVNDAPIALPQTVGVEAGSDVSVTLTATDVDGDLVSFDLQSDPTSGTLVGYPPTVIYVPEAGFTGADSFTFLAADGFSASDPATITINVSAGNTAPVAIAQSVTVAEDGNAAITLSGSDADGDDLSYALQTSPSNGALSGTPPNVTYTPNADFVGEDAFTFVATDNLLTSTPATVSVTVTAVNDAPVAEAQSISVAEDSSVGITLTGADVDGDALSYEVANSPLNGTLSGVAPDLTYTPNADFFGSDSFTFRVMDSATVSANATVSITVDPVNDLPVAVAQSISLAEDGSVSITLAGTDAEGDPITFATASSPTSGTLTGTVPNLTYTPNANFNGSDALTFTVSDGQATSEPATVSFAVSAVNDAPIALPKSITLAENDAATIVLEGTDVDGDTLTYTVDSSPTNGLLTGIAPDITYTPNTNFAGADSFTFFVNDGTINSASVTVDLTISDVSMPPVATAQAIAVDEDSNVAVTLTGTDPDGDSLTFVVETGPTNGALSGNAPNLTYTPTADFFGTDSFSFTASDETFTSDPVAVTVTINPTPDAPVADTLMVTTAEDSATLIALSGSDVDGDTLTFTVSTQPTNGVLSGTAPNLNYTPNANFFGTDTFSFVANDGTLTSVPAAVAITVTAANDAPVAAPQSATIAEDTPVGITLAGADPDGDVLTFSVATPPTNGVLTGTPPNLTYTPSVDFFGSDSFSFVASDGIETSGAAVVDITVTAVNDMPVANGQMVSTPEATPRAINLTGADIDGDALTFSVVTNPTDGVLSGTPPALTYTPNTGFSGNDTFTFVANDGTVDSVAASVDISVTDINMAPMFTSTPPTAATAGVAFVYDAVASDPDGDSITYALIANPAGMTTDAQTGRIEWTPTMGGDFGVSVTATDPAGEFDTQTFTVSVAGNSAPEFTQLPLERASQNALYRSEGAVFDADGDLVTVELVSGPTGAVLNPLGGNRFEVVWLTAGSVGATESLELRATDINGAITDATVTLTITAEVVNRSTLGTDFWLAHTSNFSYTSFGGILRNSDGRRLQVAIAAPEGATGLVEIANLSFQAGTSFTQAFDLQAGETVVIDLPDDAVVLSTLEDVSVATHVTSDRPIAVAGFNWANTTTDAWLAIPTPALGTNYQIGGYEAVGRGAEIQYTVVAVEPGETTVTVVPESGRVVREDAGQDAPTIISLSVAGEADRRTSLYHSGVQISADKPIVVYAGSNCAVIPAETTACDHLVEQITPEVGLASEYIAAPLETRVNGSFYRIIATDDATTVTVNGALLDQIDNGERIDRFLTGPVHIVADKPVLALQYAPSNTYDNAVRPDGPSGNLADPFMLQLAPADAYLSDYTFTVIDGDVYPPSERPPEFPLAIVNHYINVTIRAQDAGSLVLNGQPVDTSAFVPVGSTGFLAGSLELSPGTYRVAANGLFGLVSYGFGPEESYGYYTGLAFPSSATNLAIAVTPQVSTLEVGAEACFDFVVTNGSGEREPRARYTATVAGVLPTSRVGFADDTGAGMFCYTQSLPGQDTVTLAVDGDSDANTVDWLPPTGGNSLPPVFTSTPGFTLYDPTYIYPVTVADPNGDTVTVTLTDGPTGMQYDAIADQVVWTPAIPADRESTVHSVELTATDSNGQATTQSWQLTVHYPPLITAVSPATTGTAVLDGTVDAIGGDYALLDARVANGPVAGSQIFWGGASNVTELGDWTFTVNAFDVNTSESYAGFNRVCLAPGAAQPGYQVQRIRSLTTTARYGTAVGAVSDTNGDGNIDNADDIFAFSVSDTAVALDNLTTGQSVWSVPISTGGSFSAPAIANLDADPEMEMLAAVRFSGAEQITPTAFDTDGAQLWKSPTATFASPQAEHERPLLVDDLNNDGSPEIIAGGYVLSNGGALLWQFDPQTTGGVNVDDAFAIPVIADLDGDGQKEVLFSNEVRRADGSLYWTLDATTGFTDPHAQFGLGDIDGDGNVDVVGVVSDGTDSTTEYSYKVFAWRGDGTLIWGPVGARGFSVPVVADVDADGDVEVYLVDDQQVISATGTVEYRSDGGLNNRDEFHRLPIFDLNGDGTYERFLFRDGNLPFTVLGLFDSSAWVSERPVQLRNFDEELHRSFALADIDHDGSLDIVLGSIASLHVYASADQSWVGTARDFRQFADLSNPNFGIDVVAAPIAAEKRADLWIGELTASIISDTQIALSATVRNRGTAAVSQSGLVRFYRGRTTGGTDLGTAAVPPLGIAESTVVTVTVDRSDVTDIMSAAIEPDPATAQCETTNDSVEGVYFEFDIFDLDTAYRTATESLVVRPIEAALTPVFSQTVQDATVVAGSPFSAQAIASVANIGEAVFYAIPRPSTLAADIPMPVIDPATGTVAWTPTQAAVGPHTFTVNATSLQNRTAQDFFTLTVQPRPNVDPQITSSPPTLNVNVGDTFTYNVVATDADGDVLTYALSAQPLGMTIDSVSGVITWLPTSADAGDNAVEITVTDGFDGSATQPFVLAVTDVVNTTPDITSAPAFSAKTSFQYTYQVVATDAENDPLTYSLTTAPPGMSVDSSGLITWTPTSVGDVTVRVRVSDGLAFIEQEWMIDVKDGAQPLDATLYISPATAELGETVSFTLLVENAAGELTFDLTIDGNAVPMDVDGTASVVASTVGLNNVSVSVSDTTGTIVRNGSFTVIDPGNQTEAPTVDLLMPGNEQEVTAPTDIIGTVIDDNLSDWTVFLLEANRPTSEAIVLATGTNTFTDGVIGQIDPTMLLNGLYKVTLQAEDESGNVSAITRAIRVTGNMKVGNFSISFEDLSVPVAGIPISVTRTYDSRQRNKSQDFGFGWTIDYQNVRVQESRDLGFSWTISQERFGLFGQTCVRPNGNPTVTVTLPDGEVETFQAKADPECSFVAQPFVDIVFESVDFTSTELRLRGLPQLRIINNNLVDPDEPDVPIDPTLYELETDEGVIYELDQNFGITRIVSTHEEDGVPKTLTFSDTGIIHSDGYALAFVRDGLGRIEQIQVPDGTVLQYDYDANGDLISFTDQVNQATTFTYRAGIEHYLEDIVDPRGIIVARNLYDAEGRLEATIDADGNRIEYTHNIAGRTETIRDRRGNSTTYIYDDDGNVLSETNALNETTLRTYDLDRNVLTESDPLGHTTTFTYDLRGNVLTEEDPLGNTTTSTYDDRNLLLTLTDPLGILVATNTYDTRNTNLLTTTDALGQVTQFKWDSGIGGGCGTGASRGVINALGDETFVQPKCGGLLADLPGSVTDERGTVTTFDYDTQGRLEEETTTRTDADGMPQTYTTFYVYDAKGRLTQTTDAEGNVTTTEYNGIDKVSATVDARNHRTEMDYDARGNLVQTRYPDGTSEIMDYDENGNLILQTDRDSRTTHMTYDAADRLLETIYPDATPSDLTDNPRTTNEYDDAGRLTAVIDERGNRTEYEYDDANRQTLIRNALGQETRHEYDARGLRTATIDALSRRTTFVYDDLGRLIETIMPDGVTDSGGQNLRTTMTYDALGRKRTETDPAGEVTTFEYDEVGNLTAVIDALNQRTEYGYDEQNNKIRQTDAELQPTTWAYDNLGRVIGRTLPLGQSESYVYDAVGNRTSMTDFNNVTTTYTYDSVDRLTRTDHGDGRVYTMTYTGTGQLASAVDARGTTSYVYDERDRLTQITYPDGRTIDYGYDAASNRTSLTTANQLVTTTYDVLNRPATVIDGSGTTTYGYDAVGNRASVDHANGTRVEYSYDTLNRLTELRNLGPAPTRATVSTHTYTLGDAGNRLSLTETLTQPDASTVSRTTAYTYDALYRLESETITDAVNGNRSTSWTYDAVGNRQTQTRTGAGADFTTYVYDLNDRLSSETTNSVVTTYTYDDNGNTLTKTAAGIQVASYGYDSEDRMTRATINDGGNTTVTLYEYDVQGVRQSETTGGIVRTFLVDSNRDYAQVIEEGDNVAGLERLYTHGDDLINQTRITGPTPADEFVDVYLYDGLGSVRSLSSEAAAITDTYLYEAFGDIDVQNGTTENRYLFTGEQYDPNVGFYYLRARYYDPSIGRFPTMDTFQGRMFEPATLHKYTYVHNNPINMIDPSGLLGVISLSLNSVSTTSVRVARTRSGLTFVAKTGLEIAFELATGVPVIVSPKNIARAVRRFPAVGSQLAKGGLNKLKAGNNFEKKILEVFKGGLAKNKACFADGMALQGRRTRGCKIPDVFKRGRQLVEIKTSLGAVKKAQFQEFLRIASNGTPFTMIVRSKPTTAQLERLQRYANEVIPDAKDVFLKIIHIAD
ncbi:MAG: Ig-like domain-containing protein [Pseudomonadota bacterium]